MIYRSFFYFLVLAGFIVYQESIISHIFYPLIQFVCKPVTRSQFNYSLIGIGYFYVSALIITNLVIGSLFFGYNSTQELVAKIKSQKKVGNVNKFHLLFLTLRFYLTAIASAFIVHASLYTTLQILFNKYSLYPLDISVYMFILLLLIHLKISCFQETRRWQIFSQAFALIVINWAFLFLSLKGHAFDILTISDFNLGVSIAVAVIYRQGPVVNNKIIVFFRKLALFFIGNHKDSVRKKLVALLRLRSTSHWIFSEKRYFLRFYSFMAFTRLVSWIYNYNWDYSKQIFEDQYLICIQIFVILIGIFLSFLLLREAARYSCPQKKVKSVANPTYYVPLDFCILYGGLIKPLVSVSYETWLFIHNKSVKGFGLTIMNPAEICITKELPHYVMYIASPSEGFWNFLTVGIPQTMNACVSGVSKLLLKAEEQRLKSEIDLDNTRLDGYMPHVQVLKNAATDPKDFELLEKYSQLTYKNANPRHTLSESSASVAARDAAISEFVNTSSLCRGTCPVSPRSGLAKLDQFGICLKNAAEKAASITEQL